MGNRTITTLCISGFLLLFAADHAKSQVTGLAGWDIYLDPGHSQNENVGVFGYSEARKNLRVALALRNLLLTTTDIDTVYMSRTNDSQLVSLTQRSDHANTVGASWYHSIHSDAGPSNINRALLLWGQNGNGTEKVPNGGKAMSDIMIDRLSRGMRIPAFGSVGDCSFYGCSASSPPWLSVNRRTTMPSELSEAGFHTNPTQNQRNMNADWKVLEARTFYWSILDFHGITRPPERIVTGIVRDAESGKPLNGALITLGDTTYTTDTFESLFNQFSSDPDQLSNGFYFLDRLPEGPLDLTVEAQDYDTFNGIVTTTDAFFSFVDVELVSQIPPVVISTTPVDADTMFSVLEDILIQFSRPMNEVSVEAVFEINPVVSGTVAWLNGSRTLKFVPDSLPPLTNIAVSIGGAAEGQFGDPFDGNGDGTGGDSFTLTFRTGFPDALAPAIVTSNPRNNSGNNDLQPIVSVEYDEEVVASSVRPDGFRLVPNAGGPEVPGELRHYAVGGRSVIQFFPDSELTAQTIYRFEIDPGIRDAFGNVEENPKRFFFGTGSDSRASLITIDNFESDPLSDWWAPQQSGSTTGIITDSTARSVESRDVGPWSGTSALRVDYGWDTSTSSWLIREYLSGGPPRAKTFDDSYLVEALVFGDGSGNLFRFAVDDRLPDVAAQYHEVSPWYTIDWRGWRRVSWDLTRGETGSWLGDGVLDGTLRFDSFQLSHSPGNAQFGRIVIDNLQLTRFVTQVATERLELPDRLVLHPAYPNPFNPTTNIRFEIPSDGPVTLSIFDVTGRQVLVLVDRTFGPGTHLVSWNAEGMASGVYLYRITFAGQSETRRMMLIR